MHLVTTVEDKLPSTVASMAENPIGILGDIDNPKRAKTGSIRLQKNALRCLTEIHLTSNCDLFLWKVDLQARWYCLNSSNLESLSLLISYS